MSTEKAGQAPEVEATSAQGVEAFATAAAIRTDEGETVASLETLKEIGVDLAAGNDVTVTVSTQNPRCERYHTAAREINRIKEIIGTQPESRYKSLAATAIELAALWLDATVDENDHRRFALVATNAELAELWLIRS